MMLISQIIEDANSAVTNIKAAHTNMIIKLMQNDAFSKEQKAELMKELELLDAAIIKAQDKFTCETQEQGASPC